MRVDGAAVALRAELAARDPQYREAFPSATCRAVAGASTVAELTVPFLAVGGRALLQRGGRIGSRRGRPAQRLGHVFPLLGLPRAPLQSRGRGIDAGLDLLRAQRVCVRVRIRVVPSSAPGPIF